MLYRTLIFFFLLISCRADAFLASVNSMGMAGAAKAYPLDTLAGAYNPAGMPRVGNRIDLGGAWVVNTGKLHVDSSTRDSFSSRSQRNFILGEFGINGVWCGCDTLWSLGLISYPRNFQKRHFESSFKLFRMRPTYINYTIAPVLAVEFEGCLAVGISLDWEIAQLKTRHCVPFRSSEFKKHTDSSYSHGVTVTVGARWQVVSWLALGATYQPKAHMSKFRRKSSFPLLGRMDLPERFGAGLQLSPLEGLVLCFDAEWIKWKDCSVLQNSLLQFLHFRKDSSRSFKDQTCYRFGVEYQPVDCLSLRAGYIYSNSPIRNGACVLDTLAVDTVENYVTAGFSYICCFREFSAFYAYGFKSKLSLKQVSPSETKSILGIAYTWIY